MKRGISLPEILVALAVFALIALIVLLVFGGGLRHLLGMQGSSVALHLAQEKIEEYLAKPQGELTAATGHCTREFTDYTWKVDVAPLPNGITRLVATVRGRLGESATLTAYHRASPGFIVYAQPINGGLEAVFKCKPDGTGVRQLTDGRFRDTQPVLSPDGKRIAFVSNRDGFPQLYLLDLATRTATRLTSYRMGAQCPSWSPDGAMLAYVANDNGHSQIFVAPAAGGGGTNISRSDFHETAPCWSPDGTHLCWVTSRYGGTDLVIGDRNGGDQERVVQAGRVWSPAWSPSGHWIACVSSHRGSSRIFLVDPNSHELHILTPDGSGNDDEPSWSPDGLQVVFDRKRRIGQSALYLVNSDGSGMHPLSTNNTTTLAHAPAWVR